MPMAKPIWIFNPVRINSLRFLRDGLGNFAFPEIASGMLMGYPFLESTTVTSSIVMLVDGSQVLIASDLTPQISISSDTSLHMDTAPATPITAGAVTSMFQSDLTAVRALTRLDFHPRYDECVQVITGVAY